MNSLYDKCLAFWAIYTEYCSDLEAYARGAKPRAKASAGRRAEAMERLRAAGLAIHPKLQIALYADSASPRMSVYAPIKDEPYLYFVLEFLSRTQPEELRERVRLGQGKPRINILQPEDEDLVELMNKVYASFVEGEPIRLQIWSGEVNLYEPETFYRCLEALDTCFGETLTRIFLSRVEVLDDCPANALTMARLAERHHALSEREEQIFGQTFFPPIPFDPIKVRCSYQFTEGFKGMRKMGNMAYAPLIDEMPYLVNGQYRLPEELPNTRRLMQAGASIYTLHMHYPEEMASALGFASKLHALLRFGSEAPFAYILGTAEGGEMQDIYIMDILVADTQRFDTYLREVCELYANCHIDLLEWQTEGEMRLRTLYDHIAELSVEELERRKATSVDILTALQRIKTRTEEHRLIEGRALNGTDQYEEAIKIFKALEKKACTDPRLYYGLGYAYKALWEEKGQALIEPEEMIGYFQRAIAAGHRQTFAASMIAQLYFALSSADGDEALYQEGRAYLRLAQESPEEFVEIQHLFHDFDEELSEEGQEVIRRTLRERLGEPRYTRRVVLHTGFSFYMHFYGESEFTKACQLMVTEGLSNIPLGHKDHKRMELLFALPTSLDLGELYEGIDEHWIGSFVMTLRGSLDARGHELELDYFKHHCLEISSFEGHPYGQEHNAFLLRLSPTKVFKAAASRMPFWVEEERTVAFVSVTPIYNEELLYTRVHNEAECKASGIYSLPHAYEFGRPKLGLSVELEEFDLDELLDGNLPMLDS